MQRNDLKIYGIDLDKTLTIDTAWDEESALNCQPNTEMIDYVNNLFDSWHCIIIYTARPHRLYPQTVEWLNRNGVKYSAIRTGKLACDHYICDKTYWPEGVYKP